MNYLEKIKKQLGSINFANVVPDHIKEQRMSVCKSCEFLFTPTQTCKKCGCFITSKTSFGHFMCPINKWGKYPDTGDTE